MAKNTSKKQQGEDTFTTIEFETFRRISSYEINSLTFDKPSSFNGNIRIFKYRIKIERIEEPKEIYQERLQTLWDEADNWYHHDPIKNMAKELDIQLNGDFGNKKRKF